MASIVERIYRSGIKFLTPLDLEETYQIIVQEAVKLIRARSAVLYLAEDDKLTRKAHFPVTISTIIEPRGKGFTYKAYRERKIYIVGADKLGKIHPELANRGVGYSILIPISYHKTSIGTLDILTGSAKQPSDKELDALALFGSYASLAIRKAQLNDENIKALEMRDLFISMAAHEFRTPVTTIHGYIQLLHSKLSGLKTQESKWVEELLWESHRLIQLVNELLAVNRIKTGQLQYVWKECSLREVVSRALIDFKFNHPTHIVNLQDHLADGNDKVIGDFDKLLQVVINLLDNAAKFSPEGSEITVALYYKSPFILISVKDKGIGISKEDLPKIFEGYYKGRDGSRGGIGLGLYLAKNIIERHHGEINLHSKPGKGVTAEIKLKGVKYGRV